jgi:hypothetical protein
MAVTSKDAEKIVEDILSAYDEILAISVMDMRGNTLAANSKEAFRESFRITEDRAKNSGILAVAILSLVNDIRNIFGAAKAIITIHENCKLMLLPLPSFQLLVGFVLQHSANVEDKIANEFEMLMADILNQSSNS